MKVKVTVLHVQTPQEFWATDKTEDLEKLNTEMLEYQEKTPHEHPKTEDVNIGGVFACKFEDGDFYRCKVKRLIGGDRCEVTFIDFGNFQVLKKLDLFVLPSELKENPHAANCCHFSNYQNGHNFGEEKYNASLEEVKSLLELAEDIEIEVRKEVAGHFSKLHYVDVFQKDVNLGEKFEKEGHLKRREWVNKDSNVLMNGDVKRNQNVHQPTHPKGSTNEELNHRQPNGDMNGSAYPYRGGTGRFADNSHHGSNVPGPRMHHQPNHQRPFPPSRGHSGGADNCVANSLNVHTNTSPSHNKLYAEQPKPPLFNQPGMPDQCQKCEQLDNRAMELDGENALLTERLNFRARIQKISDLKKRLNFLRLIIDDPDETISGFIVFYLDHLDNEEQETAKLDKSRELEGEFLKIQTEIGQSESEDAIVELLELRDNLKGDLVEELDQNIDHIDQDSVSSKLTTIDLHLTKFTAGSLKESLNVKTVAKQAGDNPGILMKFFSEDKLFTLDPFKTIQNEITKPTSDEEEDGPETISETNAISNCFDEVNNWQARYQLKTNSLKDKRKAVLQELSDCFNTLSGCALAMVEGPGSGDSGQGELQLPQREPDVVLSAAKDALEAEVRACTPSGVENKEIKNTLTLMVGLMLRIRAGYSARAHIKAEKQELLDKLACSIEKGKEAGDDLGDILSRKKQLRSQVRHKRASLGDLEEEFPEGGEQVETMQQEIGHLEQQMSDLNVQEKEKLCSLKECEVNFPELKFVFPKLL